VRPRRTRAVRRAQAFQPAETLPQGEFISPEDVQIIRGPRFAPGAKWGGKIEGELKQKLMELRG
jgi:hypothetical protein